nr:MAG: hypothetical protein DIU80_19655 [Chloroflexota bacterium]
MGAIAERSGARAIERLEGAQEAQLWEQVADLPQTAALAPGEAVVKLSVLPGDVEQVATRVEAFAAAADGSALIGARALSGVIYARLRGLDGPVLSGTLAELPGVQWVATDLPGVPRWGPPPQGIEVMQRIKREFDPHTMLNPGRFVPGI